MKRKIKKFGVAMPCYKCDKRKKRKKKKYRIYQVYYTVSIGSSHLYKFGFAKKKLPKKAVKRTQERLCNKNVPKRFGCYFLWSRDKVKGWFRARMWESAYVARYKKFLETGCPPGNKNIC